MCDYSLKHVRSRNAKKGDQLFTRDFGTGTRGFAAKDDQNVAVCVMPGTEIGFEENIVFERARPRFFGPVRMSAETAPYTVAVFRQVDLQDPSAHHDALEFPDGLIVKLNCLVEGQTASVLQLPAPPMNAIEANEQKRAEYV